MISPSPSPRVRRGFSLVETLVVIVISMLVAGTIVTLMVGQMRTTSSLNRDMLNEQSLRDNMAYVMDEVNAMGNGTAEPFISEATETSLQFNGDVDNDGTLDQIQYIYDAGKGTLSRVLRDSADGGNTWDDVATDVLIPNIEELEFSYFATGNEDPLDADAITAVQLRVKLNEGAGATEFNNGRIAEEEQVSRVTIRNRTLD
ncbi:prepilin-type N-terminal cleavage/methylation domain-containing protein [bacterium]|nr:prepilin-type N-terminal cleavage/methylation domain-containing protein [bacterium]